MIPFLHVLEHDINCALEGDNDEVEQEIENEVLNSDTIQTSHDCFIIVNPNEACEEWLINQRQCIVTVTTIEVNERLDLLQLNIIHFDVFILILPFLFSLILCLLVFSELFLIDIGIFLFDLASEVSLKVSLPLV